MSNDERTPGAVEDVSGAEPIGFYQEAIDEREAGREAATVENAGAAKEAAAALLAARREMIFAMHADCRYPDEIAAAADCSKSTVYRTLRMERKAHAGDERCAEWTPVMRATALARRYGPSILRKYKEGCGIESIAKGAKVSPEDVRACIYLAFKGGDETLGLVGAAP